MIDIDVSILGNASPLEMAWIFITCVTWYMIWVLLREAKADKDATRELKASSSYTRARRIEATRAVRAEWQRLAIQSFLVITGIYGAILPAPTNPEIKAWRLGIGLLSMVLAVAMAVVALKDKSDRQTLRDEVQGILAAGRYKQASARGRAEAQRTEVHQVQLEAAEHELDLHNEPLDLILGGYAEATELEGQQPAG